MSTTNRHLLLIKGPPRIFGQIFDQVFDQIFDQVCDQKYSVQFYSNPNSRD